MDLINAFLGWISAHLPLILSAIFGYLFGDRVIAVVKGIGASFKAMIK